MQLHSLQSITKRKAKIVGRGIGSGKGGHTTGRGNKGQKARERVTIWFEGTKNKKSLIQRLPLLRGKGKFKPWSERYVVVAAEKLADWPENKAVNDKALAETGLIKAGEKAKIVGKQLKAGLKIEVPMSKHLDTNPEAVKPTKEPKPKKA